MGLAILAAFVLATFLSVRGQLPLSGRMGNSVNLIRTDREAEAYPIGHEQHSRLYDKALKFSRPGFEF